MCSKNSVLTIVKEKTTWSLTFDPFTNAVIFISYHPLTLLQQSRQTALRFVLVLFLWNQPGVSLAIIKEFDRLLNVAHFSSIAVSKCFRVPKRRNRKRTAITEFNVLRGGVDIFRIYTIRHPHNSNRA